ncbi:MULTISPECIES: hypothetical protein [Rhodococcus]|uniref:hypothetical protein n=1 Tax=Rhodococcus TaxID=1827 RepID=UPI0011AF1EFF|nr:MULTISPECIES: hypothetical protein [Rhodococcus]USC17299.1 hypothetical protein KZJ41_10720 [Rhodococcus sp. 11-3]WKX00600.1 hypothetical protein Q3O43_09995 [Rhodococcus aetherivorans]
MTTPQWWSQPFPPTGAIASEGIRNQLGRPPVDPLTVFVRETAQNSWDARLPGVPTTYRLELTTVSPTHRPAWERLLTPSPQTQPFLRVRQALRTPNLRLLSVVDRGTKGLGGPTRADELARDRRDWVSFVLNVGEKRDTVQGGGTYGYGKAVLYRLSQVGTILVYTRTEIAGVGLTSRLIGIALGDSYDSRERADAQARPYTGRHWWGDVQGEHVEPLVGNQADSIARMLGLRPFAEHESGTTLIVLDPDLEDFDDIESAAQHLADTIAWQLWPIMLPERGDRRLVPEVVAGGRTYAVPDPAKTYPLRMFVSAYRRLASDRGMALECKSPRKLLGRFAIDKAVVVPLSPDSVPLAASYAGVDGDPHHVCLMRSPELVVQYYKGPEPSSVNKAYAGVFRADDDLDETYAAAEPPTHDQWVHEQLTGHSKTFVKVTFTRIREQLSAFRTSVTTTTASTSGVALGAASNFLGGLVAAAFATESDGSDAGGDGDAVMGSGRGVAGGVSGAGRAGRSSPNPRDRVRVGAVGEPRVEERDGDVVVVQRFAVTGPAPVRLNARLAVATWEGREGEAPAGAAVPTVRCWVTPAGVEQTEACMVDSPCEVDLVVDPVPDTVTDIAVVGSTVGEDAA